MPVNYQKKKNSKKLKIGRKNKTKLSYNKAIKHKILHSTTFRLVANRRGCWDRERDLKQKIS